MRKIVYLIIAVLGNALGTALMANTFLGMTAWGSAAFNVSNYLGITLGLGFAILSVIFYVSATLIRKKFILRECIESIIFLVSFSFFADRFVDWFPSFVGYHYVIRLLINIVGMLVLLFSIALHIKVKRAVHPMDVFLYVLQEKVKSVRFGTYLAYAIGFSIAVVFGLLHGWIENIGEGTLLTLVCSGLLMDIYNKKILSKWKI